ncbi:flavoprotein [Pilimelia columellifera]|uniref:Flavoprotein n=1 Tax=Pilimelia columellifera subsp. columellifera TaxID=706583 RepID=A0ABP6ASD3_9ACTN
MTETSRVLYSIVCGSPPAHDVGRLVTLGQRAGWRVCVITTPAGRRFVDVDALAAQTGHPVRSHYKEPDAADVLPPPDALVVAPATANTMNKWRAGIADTLALGLLVEGLGRGLPIVAAPSVNSALAAHPAFGQSVAMLREWGVRVLFGEGPHQPHPPGAGDPDDFPWEQVVAALGALVPRPPATPATW